MTPSPAPPATDPPTNPPPRANGVTSPHLPSATRDLASSRQILYWSCLSCSWTSSRIPDHITQFWHRCVPDGIRRRLVRLPTLDDDSPQDRRRDETRDWYLSNYPRPPDPVGAREPRP